MHASYVSLFILAAFASVPALSAPLSARNIAVLEAANVVARNPVAITPPIAPTSTSDKLTTPKPAFDMRDLKLLQLLNRRSEDDSASLNGRDQTTDSLGHNNLAELPRLSAQNSHDFVHGRELHARGILTFIASNALYRVVIPAMNALSRVFHRDVDSKTTFTPKQLLALALPTPRSIDKFD